MKMMKNNSQIGFIHKDSENIDKIYKNNEVIFEQGFEREITNEPPLTFNGIGKNLKDYRIDGASGGVGDLITDISDENYGKYKVPVVVSGKNLWSNSNTFTNTYADSTAANGFALQAQYWSNNTSSPIRNLFNFNNVSTGKFTTTFNFNNYGTNYMRLKHNGTSRDIQIGIQKLVVGRTYTLSMDIINNNVKVSGGLVINNIQIEENNEFTDYEPYIEPTTTNIYLDKPIEAKANIPSEYTEVEYIKSTGTQYIDTGIIPSADWKYEIIYKDNAAQGSNYVMGSRQTTSSPIFAGVGGGQATQSISVHNTDCTTPSNYRRVNYIYKIKAEYNSSGTGTAEIFCLTNNEKFTGTQTANINATANYYIFSLNTSQTHGGMSLYKLKLWNNNVLVRDFIPCYRNSDNVAGLYDLVNNTFYTNQGTGKFIVGSIKANESISLSDTNTNIPTINGTNVLSVDTAIQPSNVYIKYKSKN